VLLKYLLKLKELQHLRNLEIEDEGVPLKHL
jgi:hypothetical protein